MQLKALNHEVGL